MTKNAQVTVPEIIDSVEALTAKMAAMREAQKVFATYTQEQVDKIFYEAAKAANQQRIPLAKMAVAETGMGVVEDKVIIELKAVDELKTIHKKQLLTYLKITDKRLGLLVNFNTADIMHSIIRIAN